jgi:hypothetical protein
MSDDGWASFEIPPIDDTNSTHGAMVSDGYVLKVVREFTWRVQVCFEAVPCRNPMQSYPTDPQTH